MIELRAKVELLEKRVNDYFAAIYGLFNKREWLIGLPTHNDFLSSLVGDGRFAIGKRLLARLKRVNVVSR
ncbi:hypothetical protein [Leminorella grimontii]|uniref:hypothetical protein n=1 Tax=Leminorella grimontii TaxID=82981 RepID=UPI001068D884|nr:hypothetical protein [Leminorella grimontii]